MICLILHQFNLYLLLICRKEIGDDYTFPSQLYRGVKMCDKMAVSDYILKIVEKNPFLGLQMRAKKMFHCHYFFCTNKQYLEIKLMPIETNRWSIFFGADEILVKLRFKGLNYHNFYIFDHN